MATKNKKAKENADKTKKVVKNKAKAASKNSTVKQFTGGKYKELKYSPTKGLKSGSFIKDLSIMLNKASVATPEFTAYDDVAESAVMQFQSKNGLKPTGVLDDKTYKKLLTVAGTVSDIISEGSSATTTGTDSRSANPHYDSFFDTDNLKLARRNHKDIKIVFGNNSHTKLIKDVFMHGVSVEVDTSGNPISEVYDFIARDIKESDEYMDTDKYTAASSASDTAGKAPSDIKYDF